MVDFQVVTFAMKNDISKVKEIAKMCVVAINQATHYQSLEALDRAVQLSKDTIKVFPNSKNCTPINGKQFLITSV